MAIRQLKPQISVAYESLNKQTKFLLFQWPEQKNSSLLKVAITYFMLN